MNKPLNVLIPLAGNRFLKKMNLDLRSALHAKQRAVVEVGLLDAVFVEVDLLEQRARQAVDDGALRLVKRAARIDDLTAEVSNHPDFIHTDIARHIQGGYITSAK